MKPETLSCLKCHKPFDLQWELKRHSAKCRLPASKHVKLKKDGWYNCDICPHKEKTSYLLKQHVFFQHSDAQVQATYRRSIEQFIGNSHLNKLMKHVREVIKKG